MDKLRRGYKDQRKKLKDLQKSRGFFKGRFHAGRAQAGHQEGEGENSLHGRQRIGHWSGSGALRSAEGCADPSSSSTATPGSKDVGGTTEEIGANVP